jgi:ABC-type polysaccharide/polyol phosphate export permease
MVGASLIDLLVAGLIFVVFAFTIGNGLPATAMWFPILIIVELAFVIGIVLLGSALNVFARDVRLAIPVAAQLLLFVTPVMYPLSSVPHKLRPLFIANPLTGLVEASRSVLVYGRAPQMSTLMPAVIGAGVAFVLGTWYFAATESRFADVV